MTSLWMQVPPRDETGLPARTSLVEWRGRFRLILDLAQAFGDWVSTELRLTARSAPAARLAILLKAGHRPISEFIDPTPLRSVSQPGPQFLRWAIADSAGKPAGDVARDLFIQLCDQTLHLEDFDEAFDDLF
jgi:hypothetical protein